jgi:5-methyltetrahydrofolate--homocysteine methyltransferase
VVVAGSIGQTGVLLDPLGDLEFEDAISVFSEQVGALVEDGVDLLWIETMSDLQEVRAALEACQRTAPGFPRVATMSFDTHGRTMMGVTPAQALTTIRGLGVVALGANCGNGPDELEQVIEAMHSVDDQTILIAKANAGLPHLHGEAAVYDAAPEVMTEYALRVRALGARIVGSCCGSTPDHIRAIAGALRGQ